MAGAPAEVADQGGREDDERERHAEEEDRDEGGAAIPTMTRFLSARLPIRTTASSTIAARRPSGRRRALDDPDLAEGGVDEESAMIARTPGRTKRAGDEPALGLVQQPADVDGELLRLGAGQEHAVVERVQEPRLADPASPRPGCGASPRSARRGRRRRGRRPAPRCAPPRRRGCRARAAAPVAHRRRAAPGPRPCGSSASPAEVGVEVLEHRPAAGEALLVVAGRRADAGDQGPDPLGLGRPNLPSLRSMSCTISAIAGARARPGPHARAAPRRCSGRPRG